jgi:hypothetical protein
MPNPEKSVASNREPALAIWQAMKPLAEVHGLFGEVYVSEDAGASWRKIAREFGEIRAAVWVPN